MDSYSNLTSQIQSAWFIKKYRMKKKLLSLKCQPSESLAHHFENFDEVLTDLQTIGCEIEEMDKVIHLLLTLPEQYDIVISSLESALTENSTNLTFLKSTLLDYEVCLEDSKLNESVKAELDNSFTEADSVEKNVQYEPKQPDPKRNRSLDRSGIENGCHIVETLLQNSTKEEINQRVNKQLFNSRVELLDIANELLCTWCGRWYLTAADLLQHKLTHKPTKSLDTVALMPPISDNYLDTVPPGNKEQLVNCNDSVNVPPILTTNKSFLIQKEMDVDPDTIGNNQSSITCEPQESKFNVLEKSVDGPVMSMTHNQINNSIEHHTTFLNTSVADTNATKINILEDLVFVPAISTANSQVVDLTDSQMISPSSFSCNICNKLWSTKYELLIHMKTHSNKSSSLIFQYNVDFSSMSSDCDDEISNMSCSSMFDTTTHTTTPVVNPTTPVTNTTPVINTLVTNTPVTNTTTSVINTANPVRNKTTPVTNKMPVINTATLVTNTMPVINTTPITNNTTPVTNTTKLATNTPITKTTTSVINTTKPVINTTPVTNTSPCDKYRSQRGLQNYCRQRKLQFPCYICKKPNSSECDHMKIHPNEIGRFLCNICNKSQARRKVNCHIKRHIISQSKIKPFSCEICDNRYTDKTGLQYHMATIHTEDKPYACNFCDEKFSCKRLHTKHENRVHKSVTYPCDMCDKVYKKKFSLNIHFKAIHLQQRPYKCNDCDKSYAQVSDLSQHKVRNHEDKNIKRYVCDVCGKGFSYCTAYSLHKTLHIKIKIFECDHCGKKFATKARLQIHMSAHIEKKDYAFKCKICKKIFSHKKYLDRHKATHGDKSFSCNICGQGFYHKFTWARHMKNPHSSSANSKKA